MFLFAVAIAAAAQDVRRETVDLDKVNELRIVGGAITGREIVDRQVSGERSQILSVDLLSSNPAIHSNTLPVGSSQAIFIGST